MEKELDKEIEMNKSQTKRTKKRRKSARILVPTTSQNTQQTFSQTNSTQTNPTPSIPQRLESSEEESGKGGGKKKRVSKKQKINESNEATLNEGEGVGMEEFGVEESVKVGEEEVDLSGKGIPFGTTLPSSFFSQNSKQGKGEEGEGEEGEGEEGGEEEGGEGRELPFMGGEEVEEGIEEVIPTIQYLHSFTLLSLFNFPFFQKCGCNGKSFSGIGFDGDCSESEECRVQPKEVFSSDNENKRS